MKNCRPPSREVRVQFYNPLTGAVVSRVLAKVCTVPDCGDVLLDPKRIDRLGRCPCCAQKARLERSA